MQHTLEVITSYIVAFFSIAIGTLVDSSNDILALGGLALLGLRIFVEFRNARKSYTTGEYR